MHVTAREAVYAVIFAILGALWERKQRRRGEAEAREARRRAGVL
jgi:hypothetical protein